MKLEINKELKENSANVTVSILEYEEGNYAKAVEAFGEETINIGGEISETVGEEKTVLVNLSDRNVKISEIAEKPISMSFSYSQYTDNTIKVANAWINKVIETIDDYVDKMSKKVDEFSGTQTVDL